MASLVPDGSAAAEAHARRCIDPKTPPADALRLMIENKFRHLPVGTIPFFNSVPEMESADRSCHQATSFCACVCATLAQKCVGHGAVAEFRLLLIHSPLAGSGLEHSGGDSRHYEAPVRCHQRTREGRLRLPSYSSHVRTSGWLGHCGWLVHRRPTHPNL